MPSEDENNPNKKFTSLGQIIGAGVGTAIGTSLSHVLGIPPVEVTTLTGLLGGYIGDSVQRKVKQRAIENADATEQQALIDRATKLQSHIADELDLDNEENHKLFDRIKKVTRDALEGNLATSQFKKDIERIYKAYRKAAGLD